MVVVLVSYARLYVLLPVAIGLLADSQVSLLAHSQAIVAAVCNILHIFYGTLRVFYLQFWMFDLLLAL